MLKRLNKSLLMFLAILMVFQAFTPALQVFAQENVDEMDMEDSEIYDVFELDEEFGFIDDAIMDELPDWRIDDFIDAFEEVEKDFELTGEDIVGELIHLREADVKHFRMSDGSMIAVMYDTPVHFQDEKGN